MAPGCPPFEPVRGPQGPTKAERAERVGQNGFSARPPEFFSEGRLTPDEVGLKWFLPWGDLSVFPAKRFAL